MYLPCVKIIVMRTDITSLNVDVIVNAANSRLEGGGGVDGAIHRASGPQLKQACIKWKQDHRTAGLPAGEAMYTEAFKLPCKFVIHTVGPVYRDGDHHEAELLASCYRHSLEIAQRLSVKSIAFPNISTGVYGYPKEEAAKVVFQTLESQTWPGLKEVYFVCFDAVNFELYNAHFSQ